MSPKGGNGGWRKSSFSGTTDCVEIMVVGDGVLLRDSKDTDGPALRFTHREWMAFLAGVSAGEFGVSHHLDTT
jgi:hypothetical protein